MKRRIGGVIASLVLATLGTVALVSYVQSAKATALAGETLVDVLIVAEPVQKGTAARQLAGAVRTEKVPAKVKAAGSVDSLASLDDLVTAVDLVPGEQVTRARFVTEAEARQQTQVPEGALQVTVALDPVRAVGGQVRAGDLVGVVASFGAETAPGAAAANDGTHLILHKVVVTSVQVEQMPPEADRAPGPTADRTPTLAPTGNLLVTLALDAASVERIVFAAERGTLWLAMEPAGAPEGGTQIVTTGNIF